MIAKLRVTEGADRGKEFNLLKDGRYSIGRSLEADFQIADMMASRVHAVVTVAKGKAVIEDLKSTNGTLLNGKPIQSAPLHSGDVITIGSTSMEFLMVMTAPSAAVPPKKEEDPTKPVTVAESGRVIGGYKIIERLGVGGMGTVYKAIQVSMGRVVAFKVLNITSYDTDRAIKEFLREARTGASLNHPNIVTFYDCGCDKGVYYIAMEFIEGVPLDKILEEKGAFDVSLALEIAIQVTDALSYMYSKGIIHRDVKPSNIMLTRQRVAKLTDFGLAKQFVRSGLTGYTKMGEGKGTLEYMPPEQISDALHCDQRADIYAIGATLYDMLTGKPPFSGESIRHLIESVERRHPTPIRKLNPNVPDYVCFIVEKCMRKRPEERYQYPDELLRDLRSAQKRLREGG
ncbi:MAG: serine/threonine-protein kinase [Planctomycetota bacterium]|nr:serine/threonine-protein kinase [Planctomycetota bacterium]